MDGFCVGRPNKQAGLARLNKLRSSKLIRSGQLPRGSKAATVHPLKELAERMQANSNSSSHQQGQVGSQAYKIITQYGDMLVVKQGVSHRAQNQAAGEHQHQHQHQARPVIMTFHDLGLNSELQFATFCECDEVKFMLQTFTMIHVNFIGQEFATLNETREGSGASGRASNRLPDNFKYPSVEQMAESIVDVCTQLKVRSFIALAVGAGAHVVGSLAIMRPDLVDGLFLINPIVSGCSITEWLYFKMSSIATSRRPSGGGGGGGGRRSPSSSEQQSNSSRCSSPARQPAGGIKKLLNAAHINVHSPLPASSSYLHIHLQQERRRQRVENGGGGGSGELVAGGSEEDAQSVGQLSTQSSQSSGKPHQRQPGSRLRRLILSRNFRLSGAHQASQHEESSELVRASSASSRLAPTRAERADELAAAAASGCGRVVAATTASTAAGAIANGSPRSEREDRRQQQVSQSCSADSPERASGKRPPLEYLMYHHFGPASFQRYRRSSDTPTRSTPSKTARAATATDDEQDGDEEEEAEGREFAERKEGRCLRDSLVGRASRFRSGSCSLNSTLLASFTNERQRRLYMQNVYRHYFSQINAHNLWLFAHTFVKRRGLNLRKDCGAAAHAAAAAAALGTSICTAFVGSAAPSSSSPGCKQQRHQHHNHSHKSGERADEPGDGGSKSGGGQQALVAGTKVKRTFTCQTLVMCSSVQMHCERAFKLMSLLNPLQATWIKTDHLLVLEERPEKVCQALRLFLQGIGYSMSTYERRLRLNSGRGSGSSADSSGSARSLNESNVKV